ncbi:hypothetical protein KKC32_00345 [Patescibacteria group bacterium]|nr:hypothetical protein [Patescibacteria group bacterium]
MKITICGSVAFFDEMNEAQKNLEELGHEVKLPPFEIADESGKMISVKEYYERRKAETDDDSWIWERKEAAMRLHFQKVEWSDAVLILNFDKNEIPNYIGANTLLEMGLAFHLNKKIFLLNDLPEISYKEEILGMRPIVIFQDLKKIE